MTYIIRAVLVSWIFSIACLPVSGQVPVPANTLVVQHFDGLGSSATASLPPNWKFSSAGTGASSGWLTGTNTTSTSQAANSGNPVTGAAYNWGTSAGTDRAIGFLASGSYASPNAVMAYFRNTTGGTVTSITVSYELERYRVNSSAFQLQFYSSTDGSTWTARTGGDISGSGFPAGAASYTFSNPLSITRTVTISGLSIANNGDFYLRWLFSDGSAAIAQGLGLDNVRLYAGTATPVLLAQLRDALTTDNIPLNQANPGDELTYTTVLKNTGSGNANSVSLTIPAPTNTTLTGGSVVSSALARDDSFATGLNTTHSGNNVLTNDFGLPSLSVVSFGPTFTPGATAAGGSTVSDNGATVTVQADGSFTYTPVAGFAGTDQFAYTASSGTSPDNTAVVTVTVGTAAASAADNYAVTGNISITHNSSTGLLSNDAGSAITVTAVNGNAANVGAAVTTGQGGTVTVQADGSFNYNPPAGFEGADNFTYSIDNRFGVPSVSTVTFTISGMIWFVNNAAGSAGDGRLSSPFNTLAAFTAVNNGTGNNPAAGEPVFIYTGAGNYTGGTSLLNNQRIIGQGASVSVSTASGITTAPGSATLPATGGTNPVIIHAAGNGITLAQGNHLRGISIGNCSGSAISGTNFGTLTLSEVAVNTNGQALSLTTGTLAATFSSISSSGGTTGILLSAVGGSLTINGGTISGPTGTCFSIIGGTLSSTYSGSLTQSNNAALVSISGGHMTGTITFNTGTLSASNGTGLQFDNADGTYNFTGTVTLNGGDAGIDIVNGSAGNFTFNSAAITNPSGSAIQVIGGNGVISHSGTISKTSAGRLVDIQSRTGGSVTLQGNLSSTTNATGINVSSNTGGTILFSGSSKTINSGTNPAVTLAGNTGASITFSNGGLSITTTSGTGFSASGGGTISVQGTSNTINSPTGTALSVISTTIGAAHLNFQSISSAGSATATGIILDNTGASGGLIVTGDGTNTSKGGNASGGTIANKTGTDGSTTTGTGIYLNNTALVVLRRMQLNDFQNLGIYGTSVNGLTLQYCTINGVNGTSTGSNDACLAFGKSNPSGTNGLNGANPSLIDNCIIRGGIEHNLEFYNQSGSFTLTISNSDIRSNSLAGGGDGIQVEMQGSAVASITVSSCAFDDNKSQAIQMAANDNSSLVSVVNNCTVQRTTQGNEGFIFSNGSAGQLNASFNNNTLSGIGGVSIFVGQTAGNASSSSSLTASITGNVITAPASATNSAIIAFLTSTVGQVASANITISGNTVTQGSTVGTCRGIFIDAPDASTTPAYCATVTNNTVAVLDNVAGVNGIALQVRRGGVPGSVGTFDVRSNTVTFPNGNPGVSGIRVRQVAPGTCQLEQGSSAGTAATVLAANNPASSTEVLGTVTVVANTICN